MRILALADVADRRLWEALDKRLLEGVELILAAGDLPASYLSFLTCFTTAPIYYVHGNHDTSYSRKPPEGCFCVDDQLINYKGLRILGLGGSMRYKPGECMYSEEEMEKRIHKMYFKLWRNKGFDILLAHAPAKGIGDKDNLAHSGFECFLRLMDRYHPLYMIHGHIHREYSHKFVRESDYNGVKVVNAYEKYYIDIPDEILQKNQEKEKNRNHR